MNKITFLLSLSLLFTLVSRADEGMWIPSLVAKLNIQKMNQLGCKLSADQIYSINKSSLKDAVVALDHGSCTAEVVSNDGLLLTNHHCGFDEIQKHSSVEHDYLNKGFWAMSHEQELPNPGKTVTFLIRIEDVTEQVLKDVTPGMDEAAREAKEAEAQTRIEREAKGNTHYETKVKSFFETNKFYLFVYETFRDVRLVGTPPQSIGKFGGETDNWVWPRHTGDFSIFRIYCSPDGKPADYSKNNVPYHPRYSLPISLKGTEKNDYSMVMGYPGTTTRFRTSREVENIMNVVNDTRIKVREAKLNIIREYMASSQKARIQYASKFARSANYYKYSIGQNNGLRALNVIEKKKESEKEFTDWVHQSVDRIDKFGNALSFINKAYETTEEKIALEYMREALLRGPEIFAFSASLIPFYNSLKSADTAKLNRTRELILAEMDEYFKDYDASTDQKITGTLLKLYAQNVAAKYIPDFMKSISSRQKGDYNGYAKQLFSKTIFTNKKQVEDFLKSPSLKKLEKDPAFLAAQSIYSTYSTITSDVNKSSTDLQKGRRLYVAGFMEMHKDEVLYPDANSTMRLTYGSVGGYYPRDAVYYNHFTTLKGYAEKGIPADVDFDYPEKLIQMYKAKDFGPYADKDSTLHTCFITNNDITGGNSGSPVMNGDGELIGIAFDGNWEAMSGDVAYEPNLQRTICVDIRFVLWTIDKFAGAGHLVKEMNVKQ